MWSQTWEPNFRVGRGKCAKGAAKGREGCGEGGRMKAFFNAKPSAALAQPTGTTTAK